MQTYSGRNNFFAASEREMGWTIHLLAEPTPSNSPKRLESTPPNKGTQAQKLTNLNIRVAPLLPRPRVRPYYLLPVPVWIIRQQRP